MKRTSILLVALVVAVLAAPTAASAQGSSAIDEYQENVPGSGGNKPSDDVGGPGSGSSLPPSAIQALEALGADGADAAALAKATGPGKGKGADGEPAGSEGGSAPPASDDGGNPLGSVIDLLGGSNGDSDSGGMGFALPLILGGTLIAALLLVALRRRGGGPGPQGA